MSFIQRELDRVGIALQQSEPNPRYAELYAVQQALMWALEPSGFKAPYDMLITTDTPVDLADCLEGIGHSASSDSRVRRVVCTTTQTDLPCSVTQYDFGSRFT